MKSAYQILKDLGFNAQAPHSTKEAFLKNLAQAAKETEKAQVIDADFGSSLLESKGSEDHQLSFDSEILGFTSNKNLKTGA